ncbi:dihydrolipoyl dehydrogenase [Treponema lecithinolyticum]|uniref:dihydrolipoyl dehydrogenase n=1 Tax=Treponema lecithinolyticum TaxID=53418 RepID=UPI0028E6C5F6|nr:dihydrolipoyl dehydrogenase [Treponema lecithinolyticum]
MYDVIIIGGGPGGYLAAERLAQRKKQVLLIEKQYLGGTCLNVGCIPTKTLLNSAKHYLHAQEAPQFGVHADNIRFDMGEMTAWKKKTVETLCSGVASLMKRLKVDVVMGTGELVAAGKVKIAETGEVHEAKAVIIAAGSVPAMPPIPGTKDNKKLLDSTALLELTQVPKNLCVIGGGVIGIEFASLFGTLGSKVTVIEMMDEIIPPMDKELAPLLRKHLKNTEFRLGCRVEKLDGGTVFYKTKEGKDESVKADIVLMAVGRKCQTESWNGKAAGIDIRPKGVAVDERMRTNVSGVWAIGDVNGKSMLAHSAYRMAEVAVNDICSVLDGTPNRDRMRYDAVPWVVYSIPEASGCGITEQEARAKNIGVKTATVPMIVSGRFVAENGVKAAGTVKVIADEKNGRILGVHILGSYASEMIWGASALIENEMRVEDVKQLIFPHPTVCEAIREAVWAL